MSKEKTAPDQREEELAKSPRQTAEEAARAGHEELPETRQEFQHDRREREIEREARLRPEQSMTEPRERARRLEQQESIARRWRARYAQFKRKLKQVFRSE